MQVLLTAADLIAFENEIADLFLGREIHAPVHLAGGNEEHLIGIFRERVEPEDWICCSWRSHYHCLVKGVPQDKLKSAIIAGKSIALCFPEYRIFSSAIAGGIAPIAVGLALGIKKKKENRKVVCFPGDMTAKMGVVLESQEYARRNALPVLWVVEDNGKSVGTDTATTWGPYSKDRLKKIDYQYEMTRPHVGVGRWVNF